MLNLLLTIKKKLYSIIRKWGGHRLLAWLPTENYNFLGLALLAFHSKSVLKNGNCKIKIFFSLVPGDRLRPFV